jgi:hypothetical protein
MMQHFITNFVSLNFLEVIYIVIHYEGLILGRNMLSVFIKPLILFSSKSFIHQQMHYLLIL